MIKLDANKIMKGSPPPLEYQVTLENWRKYPYNIWAFVNVRNIIPTSSIKFDAKQKIDFIKNTVEKFKKAKIKIYDHHKSHFFSAKTLLKLQQKLIIKGLS